MADETTRAMLASAATALVLTVIDEGRVRLFPLPAAGVVVIGRGEQADVRLGDTRVSREHARLHIGECIEIEDLNSANGTLLQNRALPAWTRAVLQPSEGVSLGGAVLMVQPAGASPVAAEPLAPPGPTPPPPLRAVVEDERMKRLYEMASRVAASNINVLVLGETGTGKELLAQTIHERSERAGRTLLCLNCAALSESLLESELFGHVRGAFTGAHQAKTGLLEAASGGTIFLDEVGEMSASTQAKLLRVLETRQVMRVGSSETRNIDVRFVSATNRNLADEVARGQFRRDLYFRLNAITLKIPPLRERTSEIEALARRFVTEACAESRRKPEPTLTPAALHKLRAHDFPGNVRELKNAIAHALLLCAETLDAEHLLLEPSEPPPQPAPAEAAGSVTQARDSGDPKAFRAELQELERRRIFEALELFAGNQTRAAEHLGISRRTLLKRLDDYGATRPRKRTPPG
jgi:two-component system response regulator AtoC